MMKILALDLGKYKTVGCEYEAESGRHRYATVLTTSALPLASSEVGGLLRIPSGFEGFPRAVVKPR